MAQRADCSPLSASARASGLEAEPLRPTCGGNPRSTRGFSRSVMGARAPGPALMASERGSRGARPTSRRGTRIAKSMNAAIPPRGPRFDHGADREVQGMRRNRQEDET
jgi:hypothetical protein